MKARIDADGQPVNRAFNAARLSDRSIDELVGFCKALVIDDRIDEQEARALHRWVEQNRHVAENWPADMLYRRVSEMLADDDFSSDESRDLLQLVREVTGGDIPVAERVASYSSTLPLTRPAPPITFAGRQFCLTGKFVLGSRRRCEEMVVARGGIPQPALTMTTDYLVIGAIGSTDWIHSTHGRKIEAAVKLQRKGGVIAIVGEEHWTSALM